MIRLTLRRRLVKAMLGASCAVALQALAQSGYPSRPVRLVVPFAPGGSADAMGRMIAEKFTAGLGQSVVVDIRTGAGGVIGSELVARAAPDGHTLLLGIAATHAIQTALGQKLPYDVVRDFAPIGQISTGVIAVSVAASLPVTNLGEFIAYAKAHPGRISYGTGGHASGGHLVGEGLAALAGIQMTHIPYKGGSPAFNDMLAGQLHAVMTDTTTTGTFNKSGKIRVIAVAGPRRSPAFPEVPTTTEQGVHWFEASMTAAKTQGERLFSELLGEHRTRLKEDRERAKYAYDARYQAIGRIGLPAVREHRRKRLDAENQVRMATLDDAEASVPDLNAVMMLRVGPV